MRRRLVGLDLLECVLGLGPNLFYNSPMEACVVVCRARKPEERLGRILFIDAVNEVARERAQSFLRAEHQQKILAAYETFSDDTGFAKVATVAEVLHNDGSLSIPRYVRPAASNSNSSGDLKKVWAEYQASGREFWQQMDELVEMLDEIVEEEVNSCRES